MTIDDLYVLYTEYPKVITDSRKAEKGSIFFALKGDNFDGNNFAITALDAGCAYAVVDRPDLTIDGRCILVDDVLHALHELARIRRRKTNIPVIAVTGTNGKTTTKELIKCVLSSKFNVFATEGNLNNHIGVPLTLLDMPQQTEIAVIEMGASSVGEIKNLCGIAEPTYGLITNIGKAHLEGFGGAEGVKRAKKELYDYLEEHDGMVFTNETNPILVDILQHMRVRKTGYGKLEESKCWGRVVSASPYLRAELHIDDLSYDVLTRMAGVYNLENLTAACCIGDYFGISPDRIVEALSGYIPNNNRSQIKQTACNQLLLDYYNANPTGMKESLNNFYDQIPGSKMVILGDMFELGEASAREHSAIIDMLHVHPEVPAMVVGERFYEAAEGIPKIHAFCKSEELKSYLAAHPPKGLFILIKGSRGMKMEQFADLL